MKVKGLYKQGWKYKDLIIDEARLYDDGIKY